MIEIHPTLEVPKPSVQDGPSEAIEEIHPVEQPTEEARPAEEPAVEAVEQKPVVIVPEFKAPEELVIPPVLTVTLHLFIVELPARLKIVVRSILILA